MKTFNPKRREEGIQVEVFEGEVLVYALEQHTAHCLNGIAVRVWNLADGTQSVADIAARIAADQGTEADEALVWRALEELDRSKLLETSLADLPADLSRRHLVAWTSAVPLVLSIAVPTPAFAQSVHTGA